MYTQLVTKEIEDRYRKYSPRFISLDDGSKRVGYATFYFEASRQTAGYEVRPDLSVYISIGPEDHTQEDMDLYWEPDK